MYSMNVFHECIPSVSTTTALSNSSPSSLFCTYSTNSTRDRRLTSSAPQLGKHNASLYSYLYAHVQYLFALLRQRLDAWLDICHLSPLYMSACVPSYLSVFSSYLYHCSMISTTTASFPPIASLVSKPQTLLPTTHYLVVIQDVYCSHTSQPTERSASQRDFSLSQKSTGFSRDNRSTSLTNSSESRDIRLFLWLVCVLSAVHYGIMCLM